MTPNYAAFTLRVMLYCLRRSKKGSDYQYWKLPHFAYQFFAQTSNRSDQIYPQAPLRLTFDPLLEILA